jgi:hypothetical protein
MNWNMRYPCGFSSRSGPTRVKMYVNPKTDILSSMLPIINDATEKKFGNTGAILPRHVIPL